MTMRKSKRYDLLFEEVYRVRDNLHSAVERMARLYHSVESADPVVRAQMNAFVAECLEEEARRAIRDLAAKLEELER